MNKVQIIEKLKKIGAKDSIANYFNSLQGFVDAKVIPLVETLDNGVPFEIAIQAIVNTICDKAGDSVLLFPEILKKEAHERLEEVLRVMT